MSVYYNEIDKFAAAWLRELMKAGQIPDGEVDERSIELVQPADVRGFRQCHFFAGIGGWPYALRLAGWPDERPVWTGSCPCQPISSAARGRLVVEDLRPVWLSLVDQCRPRTLFGEQVVQRGWIDACVSEMAQMGYSVGCAVLPACSVGLDHARERFYFVGHTNRHGEPSRAIDAEMARVSRPQCHAGRLVPEDGLSRDMVAFAGFGNAIVPQVAQAFIESYLAIDG